MGLDRNFATIQPYVPGTGKSACVPPAAQHHLVWGVYPGMLSSDTTQHLVCSGGCVVAHFLAWLSAGGWRGFPCRSQSPSHLCTSTHMLPATQEEEYAPCPSQRHNITPDFSRPKSMLPSRRDAMRDTGHSSRNKVGEREKQHMGLWSG